eukprot:1145735-Pleurochrysis_carterae.AAC.2
MSERQESKSQRVRERERTCVSERECLGDWWRERKRGGRAPRESNEMESEKGTCGKTGMLKRRVRKHRKAFASEKTVFVTTKQSSLCEKTGVLSDNHDCR